MKVIDYDILISNLEEMINILEYDSMRSTGKAKINSQHLESMYNILDRYKAKAKPVKKQTPVKEV